MPFRRSSATTLPPSHAAACIAVLLALIPSIVAAQVPTFRDVTGHDFGERITQHAEMARYLEALGAASPRVSVVDQGESWEGRRLLVAIVTSPENHGRLDQIRQTAQRLGDPRITSPEEVAQLVQNQPAIVWYGGSIHGFELSGSEGVLKLLERLASATDQATMDVLSNTVVLIDPMLNPDGRDAFASLNHENIGALPNPELDDWANDFTSWQALKFRTGHYYFDTNRDWFAQTQRETRARLPTIVEWRPQFVIDMHETSPAVEFYFDPPTEPYGQFFPDFARENFDRLNAVYSAAFDSAGIQYMTRERYNYFYPGYTTSQGSYQGAAGMLYEQGSSRGLALTRPDGSVRTLAEALEHQYLAAWTAANYAATNREQVLRDYYEGLRSAVADGRQGVRRYLIAPGGDRAHVAELVNILIGLGIEVDSLTAPARLSSLRNSAGQSIGQLSFPPGTYVIDAAQPRSRLVRVLLEPDVPLPEDFLRDARQRVGRAENPRFYDITAWSLPLLFDVDGYSTTDDQSMTSERVTAPVVAAGSGVSGRATYAYLIEGNQAAAVAAVYRLIHDGYRAGVTIKPTSIAGSYFPSGTAVIHLGENDDSVHEAIRDLAQQYALDVRTATTGLADTGFPSLGSADVIQVRKPEIAILAEDPIHAYSFGWAWYTLDRQYDISTTVLRVRSVARTPLDRFNVLIVPATSSAALAAALGENGVSRIRQWVRDGGTLVAIAGAVDFVRDSSALDLVALRSWYDTEDGADAQHFSVPGAIMRVTLDPDYWLSAGYADRSLPTLVNGSRLYLAPEGPPSARRRVVARYAGADSLRLSGHAWPESLERLPDKVFLYEQRVARGRVIAFAEEVNFRAFWRGANRLFLNAVVIGPSAP